MERRNNEEIRRKKKKKKKKKKRRRRRRRKKKSTLFWQVSEHIPQYLFWIRCCFNLPLPTSNMPTVVKDSHFFQILIAGVLGLDCDDISVLSYYMSALQPKKVRDHKHMSLLPQSWEQRDSFCRWYLSLAPELRSLRRVPLPSRKDNLNPHDLVLIRMRLQKTDVNMVVMPLDPIGFPAGSSD